jgi:flagellar biosynthesis/type III secretory pathway protein FliH
MPAKKAAPVLEPKEEVKALSTSLTVLRNNLVLEPENANDAAVAVGQRAQIKDMQKKVKERKEAVTKPLNEALKATRSLFKPLEDQLADMCELVTNGLEHYEEEVRESLAAKAEAVDKKVDAGKMTETKAQEVLVKTSIDLGAGVIPTRAVKVVDIVDPNLVPDAYWIIDEAAIRQDALAGIKIPGVVVREERQIYNRR